MNRAGMLLRKHLERGGGLLILAGPHVDPGRYVADVFGATAPRGSGVPLVRYEAAVGNPEDESAFQTISSIDNQHPALAQFERGDIDYFGTARLYRYQPLVLGNTAVVAAPAAAAAKAGGAVVAAKAPISVQTLMKIGGQSPVMVETGLGAGRMLVCSFAATPAWSNLPTRALFVPLLLRSIAHLRPAAVVEAVAAVRPHEPAPIRLSQQWQGARVEATSPDGQIHPIELHASEDRLVGALLQTDERGYYQFSRAASGQRGERIGRATGVCREPGHRPGRFCQREPGSRDQDLRRHTADVFDRQPQRPGAQCAIATAARDLAMADLGHVRGDRRGVLSVDVAFGRRGRSGR